jgi:NUMOD3 motif
LAISQLVGQFNLNITKGRENHLYCLYWIKNADCINPEIDGYIGITGNQKKRWNNHCSSKRFPEDSVMIVLFVGTKEECRKKEREYRPDPFIGWNIAEGGSIPPSWKGRKHSEESKKKISKTRIKKKIRHSPEVIQKISESRRGKPAWNKGIKVTDQNWLNKLSESHKGQQASEETRRKISEANKGRIVSETTRQKIKKANIGKKASPETILKLRASHLGKKQSQETIEKRRQSQIGKKRSDAFREKMRLIRKMRGKSWLKKPQEQQVELV